MVVGNGAGQLHSTPARIEKIQHVENLKLERQGLRIRRRQRLANGQVRQVHPRRATTVARHDASALLAADRVPVDEAIERRLLRCDFRRRTGEPDLGRVGGRARDVDRIISNCAVGIQIAATLRSAGDVRVREARSADIGEREIGPTSLATESGSCPTRGREGAGRSPTCPGSIVLTTGDRTAEAPVVDEERAHWPGALRVARASVTQRKLDVGDADPFCATRR